MSPEDLEERTRTVRRLLLRALTALEDAADEAPTGALDLHITEAAELVSSILDKEAR